MWYFVLLIAMATRSVFVLATVVSIRDKFCYPCCTQCHKKVHTREDEVTFWCEGCREQYRAESVQYRYRISVMASDRTHVAQITVFGSCLDRFFGTSATNFMRFVNSVNSDASSTIPWTRAVYQAMEQCFVGALLQFGFRIYSPCRTASQISRNSPFHLKNIVNKQRKSENTRCQSEQFPSLLACQILPSSPTDQSPTVLQILNEYLQELHRRTPQSFNVRSSQHSPSQDGFQSQGSFEAFLAARRASVQGKRTSSIYCTPQEFGSMNTPLVLTSSSLPSSGSVLSQENVLQTDSKGGHEKNVGDISSSSLPNEDINSRKSQSPRVTQLVTPANPKSVKLDMNLTGDSAEQQLSHVWTEYDDFPSSEDLSAFLADLEREEGGTEGQTLPNLPSKKCDNPQAPVTSDASITEITTLKDVCEMSRTSKAEDFTEFTDFPSSEDLDAFLADMEFDCEHIPVVESLTPKTSIALLNGKSHNEKDGSKYLVHKEHVLEDAVDSSSFNSSRGHHEDNIETEGACCDMGLSSNSCCTQETARPLCNSVSASEHSDNTAFDSDGSDSQFLRDCESVLSELTDIRHEDKTASKPNHLLRRVLLSNQFRSISRNLREDMNDVSTKRSKVCQPSSPGEEFHENDIICDTPLRDSRTSSILRSRVRNANETGECQLPNQTVAKRLTSLDHHDNSDVSRLNDSCEQMPCVPASPEWFSQSCSVLEDCSKTPDLFSSPGLVSGESRSRFTEHSTTPDLFSSPSNFGVHSRSCTTEELNSVSLFSSSECSHLSYSPSTSTRAEQQASLSSPDHLAVRGNEATSHSNKDDCDVRNKMDQSPLPLSFHSTPYCVSIPSKMLSGVRSPFQVSPLLSDADQCYDISLQGTPVLFSQLSNSSF